MEKDAEEAEKAAAKKAALVQDGAVLRCTVQESMVYNTKSDWSMLKKIRRGSLLVASGSPERVETCEETELAQINWMVPVDPLGAVSLDEFELHVRAYSAKPDLAAVIDAMDDRDARASLRACAKSLHVTYVKRLFQVAHRLQAKSMPRIISKSASEKVGASIRRMARVNAFMRTSRRGLALPEHVPAMVREFL